MIGHRLAVVTGASRGLGRALSGFLAAEQYELILVARTAGPLETWAEALRESGASVRTISGDVTAAEVRNRLRGEIGDPGRLDLLVNNASELGPSPLRPLAEIDLATMARVYEVNVLGPLGLVQTALPALRNARGLVVNISSDAAEGAYPGWGAYGASKAALDLASRTLAHELRSDGVAFVSVDPGDMRTTMHQAAFPDQDISDRPLPEVVLPFFAWLLGRPPTAVSGQRFRAQAETWQVAAA